MPTCNRPTCNEVVAILWTIMWEPKETLLCTRGGGLERISDTHRAYDPLHFRLLFPHGEHLAVRYQGDATNHNNNNNRVSCREFAAHRLHIRADGYSLLYRAARLFMRDVSTLTTKMSVPSLSGSPVASRLVCKNKECV